MPAVTLWLAAESAGELTIELRTSDRPDNHTPDVVLARRQVALTAGEQVVTIEFDADIDQERYAFVCLPAAPGVAVRQSELRVTGLLALSRTRQQAPGRDIGVETYDMWCPGRRPGGLNLAFALSQPVEVYGPERVAGPVERPTRGPNAWVAQPDDLCPTLTATWPTPRSIGRVELSFDTDFDHAMETVLMGHPERVAPFCVRHYRLYDGAGELLVEVADNHQTRRAHHFEPALVADTLRLEVVGTWGAPAAVMGLRCHAQPHDELAD